MLNFQRGSGAPNYLSRSYQWRLLLLVAMLGLVLFLVNEARKPENYAWLWAVGQQGDATDESPSAPGESRLPGGEYFPGVEPEQLAAVRDDYPFLAGDTPAWFGLLTILRDTDEAALAAASGGPATYVQLLRQPSAYRGRLVTLRGTMRRVVAVPAPENDDGFEHYYQTWLTPQDDPSSLIVVYCLNLPQGFPTGAELEEPVSLVGFFFKRWGLPSPGQAPYRAGGAGEDGRLAKAVDDR